MHRRIIDAPFWRVAGVGVARSLRGDWYWAVDFGA
jgi:uncharacterized protein YkwD